MAVQIIQDPYAEAAYKQQQELGAQVGRGMLRQMGLAPEQQFMEGLGQLDFSDPASFYKVGQKFFEMGDYGMADKFISRGQDIQKSIMGVSSSMTAGMKDLRDIAKNRFNCDINDPLCYQKATEELIRRQRADSAAGQMAVEDYKNLNTRYEQAETSRQNILVANDSLRMLESGAVNIGSFAKTRQGAAKMYSQLLNSMGIQVPEGQEVARTEVLLANTKRLAGQLLASGMFGSGTGISERDLQTAMEMAGASETLTPEGMRQILELNAKIEKAKLMDYNKKLDRYSSAFWKRSPQGDKSAFAIDVPDIYQMKVKEPETESSMIDYTVPITGEKIKVPKGAIIGQLSDGRIAYELNGNWYLPDGTKVK